MNSKRFKLILGLTFGQHNELDKRACFNALEPICPLPIFQPCRFHLSPVLSPVSLCDVLLSYRIPSSTVLCGLQLSPSALIIISTPPSPNLTDLPTNPSSPGSTCHLTALASPILLVLAISPPSVQMKGVDPKPRLSMSLHPIVFCCCSF